MTLPNFLIIGAAKSGTSSLYMYLKQHPEIFMSPVKEPHFFSFTNESKMTNGPGDPIHEAITDFDEYQALFDGVVNEKAIGEASTSYLYREEAAKRIHDLLPNIKLIAILRNPVDRAFSAYMHVVRDRRESSQNFEEALNKEEERKAAGWEPIWHFTSVGLYFEQLKRYYDIFTREQIKVLLYENLKNDQLGLLRDVYQFLNVDPDFIPGSTARYNVSGEIRSTKIQQISKWLFSSPNPIRWISRKIVPEKWRLNTASYVREFNLKKREVPNYLRKEIFDIYSDEIKNLESLIDIDLSQWSY
ncbi:MAG: sulfotransferase [Pseudomonadota bacterium]|nr:sulfotransferase [Pseudomonadota bacterium]